MPKSRGHGGHATDDRDGPRFRRASVADAGAVARMLHDFNTEFSSFTPCVVVLTERVEELLANGQATILIGGDGPDGLAVLRFRPAIFTDGLDAYLEEFYVAPAKRGLYESVGFTNRDGGEDGR